MVKWLTVGHLLLLVAGGGESKEQAVALCHIEALKIWSQLSFDRGQPYDYMIECMTAAGYHHLSVHRCSQLFGSGSSAIFDSCYESGIERFWWENVIQRPAS